MSREALARTLLELGVVRRASAPSEVLPRLSTGVRDTDALLGGGWPLGRICGIRALGEGTAGVTSLVVATVAAATRAGNAVAWIDGDASLDPGSLRAAGAALDRVLWVRGPLSLERTLAAVEEVLRAGGFAVLAVRPPRERGFRAAGDFSGFTRLARIAEQSRAVVLFAGEAPAGTCAVRVRLEAARGVWAGTPGVSLVLAGLSVNACTDQGSKSMELCGEDARWAA
jgi:hypothetical protein